MNKNLLKLIAVYGTACFLACTAPQKAETEKWSERMARSEMQRFPEPWMIEKAKKPRWGYTHGLVVKSMLEEWKHTGDSTYYEYAKIYAHSRMIFPMDDERNRKFALINLCQTIFMPPC